MPPFVDRSVLASRLRSSLTLFTAVACLAGCLNAVEPPPIPVGLDAYRQWERWPFQRIGVRAYMRSTYDRHGNNNRADAANFIRQAAGDFNVTLDVEGRGILYFARYNHWHGSPWHYVVDGTDHVVTETSTADPHKPVESFRFEPRSLFPEPLTVTFATGGRHRLRVYPRVPGARLDQVLLSPGREQPPAGVVTAAATGEILLNPADAVEIRGGLGLLADPAASKGRALRFATEPVVREFFPAHTDTGRKVTGTSEFTLRLRSDNLGVLLRRKLDYAFPDQRAEVFVADAAADGTAASAWRSAGVWYLAGSNTWVHSYPQGETGKTQHNVFTSNRRFRDDEFLIARELTEGRSAIRVRVKFTPVNRPLFPGHPLAEQAWSEIRYDACCYILPAD